MEDMKLEEMTIAELKDYAESIDLDIPSSKKRKAEIISHIALGVSASTDERPDTSQQSKDVQKKFPFAFGKNRKRLKHRRLDRKLR